MQNYGGSNSGNHNALRHLKCSWQHLGVFSRECMPATTICKSVFDEEWI